MKTTRKIPLAGIISTVALLVLFLVFTLVVRFADRAAIGPDGSEVGFSALNGAFHDLTAGDGYHETLYKLTDILEIIPFAIVLGFAVLGLAQWIRRGSFLKVDRDILLLGAFYLLVFFVYLFFELVKVNYRPVLIDGKLETSYPSSTTMLAVCVFATAMMQLYHRIKNRAWRITALSLLGALMVFMVIARLVSGVHWLTDIVGGLILSATLVSAYWTVYTPATPAAATTAGADATVTDETATDATAPDTTDAVTTGTADEATTETADAPDGNDAP